MSFKSDTQLAAEFCMRASGQTVRDQPARPTPAERKLMCELALEEMFELFAGMGCYVNDFTGCRLDHRDLEVVANENPESFRLIDAIDACCDVNFVIADTMACIGAPDKPHMDEVCRANVAKFPGGVVTPHPTIPGKYGKPDGWAPPDHASVLRRLAAGEFDNEFEGGVL